MTNELSDSLCDNLASRTPRVGDGGETNAKVNNNDNMFIEGGNSDGVWTNVHSTLMKHLKQNTLVSNSNLQPVNQFFPAAISSSSISTNSSIPGIVLSKQGSQLSQVSKSKSQPTKRPRALNFALIQQTQNLGTSIQKQQHDMNNCKIRKQCSPYQQGSFSRFTKVQGSRTSSSNIYTEPLLRTDSTDLITPNLESHSESPTWINYSVNFLSTPTDAVTRHTAVNKMTGDTFDNCDGDRPQGALNSKHSFIPLVHVTSSDSLDNICMSSGPSPCGLSLLDDIRLNRFLTRSPSKRPRYGTTDTQISVTDCLKPQPVRGKRRVAKVRGKRRVAKTSPKMHCNRNISRGHQQKRGGHENSKIAQKTKLGTLPQLTAEQLSIIANIKIKKGKWSPDEDRRLSALVAKYGVQVAWKHICLELGGRNTKQCRERWNNHLDPTLRHGMM